MNYPVHRRIALHLYSLTRFSNCLVQPFEYDTALHLYSLTRFSNTYHITLCNARFAPLFTYKVLKPADFISDIVTCFAPLFTYKVLKQNHCVYCSTCSFAPLFTYKVLKPPQMKSSRFFCFAPLFTYKVLKPQIFFQGHHRTHNILAYVQAFSLYQRKTFSKLVMLICNNAIVTVKNIQFFTISFVIYTEFYQH